MKVKMEESTYIGKKRKSSLKIFNVYLDMRNNSSFDMNKISF